MRHKARMIREQMWKEIEAILIQTEERIRRLEYEDSM